MDTALVVKKIQDEFLRQSGDAKTAYRTVRLGIIRFDVDEAGSSYSGTDHVKVEASLPTLPRTDVVPGGRSGYVRPPKFLVKDEDHNIPKSVKRIIKAAKDWEARTLVNNKKLKELETAKKREMDNLFLTLQQAALRPERRSDNIIFVETTKANIIFRNESAPTVQLHLLSGIDFKKGIELAKLLDYSTFQTLGATVNRDIERGVLKVED